MECQNCEKEFDNPIYIEDEQRCPYCMSGDVVGGEMKTLYNTTLEIKNLTQEKYDLLIDLLEENNINYEETDFEEFTIDERTEEEKYDNWLSEQADNYNDDKALGIL